MRVSIALLYSLVVLATSIHALPPHFGIPEDVVPSPSCYYELPTTGYPADFIPYNAGVRSLQALCVDLQPGPRCTCVKIANGSWQVVCNPTGAFALNLGWPNVNTNCVWGCNCYSIRPVLVPPTTLEDALARVPGLSGKIRAH